MYEKLNAPSVPNTRPTDCAMPAWTASVDACGL